MQANQMQQTARVSPNQMQNATRDMKDEQRSSIRRISVALVCLVLGSVFLFMFFWLRENANARKEEHRRPKTLLGALKELFLPESMQDREEVINKRQPSEPLYETPSELLEKMERAGAKIFGLQTCPATVRFKRKFGNHSLDSVYVECGRGGNPELCTEKNITHVPSIRGRNNESKSGIPSEADLHAFLDQLNRVEIKEVEEVEDKEDKEAKVSFAEPLEQEKEKEQEQEQEQPPELEKVEEEEEQQQEQEPAVEVTVEEDSDPKAKEEEKEEEQQQEQSKPEPKKKATTPKNTRSKAKKNSKKSSTKKEEVEDNSGGTVEKQTGKEEEEEEGEEKEKPKVEYQRGLDPHAYKPMNSVYMPGAQPMIPKKNRSELSQKYGDVPSVAGAKKPSQEHFKQLAESNEEKKLIESAHPGEKSTIVHESNPMARRTAAELTVHNTAPPGVKTRGKGRN